MAEARKLHTLYTETLRNKLAEKNFCSRLEYTGSAYEGVKVRRNDDDSDLEFDIMVILKRDSQLEVDMMHDVHCDIQIIIFSMFSLNSLNVV